MPGTTDIDRLIEDGLDRYGSGDLDGALMAWEEALAIDPHNKRVHSYVDYVRQNYESLSDGSLRVDDGEDTPFAISEEPEYHIEIRAGEEGVSRPSTAPAKTDPVDTGWFIDEETRETPAHAEAAAPPEPEPPAPVTVELEADEPPPPEPAQGISFEEATREYASRGLTVRDLQPDAASEFEAEGTPVGFAHQATDIKKRDLGFVQARPAEPPPGPDVNFRPPKPSQPPASPAPDPVPMAATPEAEIELGSAGDSGRASTRDLPTSGRPPARDPSAVSQAEVMLPYAETKELDRNALIEQYRLEAPVAGEPTRDLGLRANALKIPEAEDDVPTRESDVRAIREHAAASRRTTSSRPLTESTRHDISLPFDPVDSKAAQILDDIDAGAAPGEAEDDRSRRRITALFERAIAYNHVGDTEKAVIAIDLALEEDPQSALAQKLIHRNRDAAMQVFQAYLGDLERQPALAKPLHELSSAPISSRAAFLMSRIDGTLTIDEILDVSGMPRMEAYRYLCQLFLRGILK